jgi:hypothetical protein
MTRFFSLLAVLLWAVPVSAQGTGSPSTGPVTVPALQHFPAGTVLKKLWFEHDGINVFTYRIRLDGVLALEVNASDVITFPGDCPPDPADATRALCVIDLTTIPPPIPGQHHLAVSAFNGNGESAGIGPDFVIDPPNAPPPPPQTPPSAPKNFRLEVGAVLSTSPARAGFPLPVFPRLIWDDVPDVVAYEVSVTWSSGRPIVDRMPVIGSQGFPFPLGMPGHRYQASVRGCSVMPPLSVPCDGAASTLVVER